MAKITRLTGNVRAFAADSLTEERTVFGDTLTVSDDLTDNFTLDYLRGWGIVGAAEYPTREDFNAMGYTLGQFVAYLYQMGIPEWDSAQEFPQYALTIKDGQLFRSFVNDNINNDPATDSGANWHPWPADGTLRTSRATGTTARVGECVIPDNSAGAVTINLPTAGLYVGAPVFFEQVFDQPWSGNSLTVGRNGNTIGGLAEDMTVTTSHLRFGVRWDGSTWVPFKQEVIGATA